ncbi:hypothetical protein GF361_01100 [Candidatus Woesearchaeota archaeon]|nr:hypothetical protein [Candidatus Woesearchaeota archaeon]
MKIKKRLKTLLPTLKEKKRYIAFEIVSDKEIKDFKEVSDEIMARSQQLIGELGIAKAGMQILKDCFKPQKQRGIIKTNHKSIDEIKTALSFIKNIKDQKAVVNPIGVSGILKKAKQRYLQ